MNLAMKLIKTAKKGDKKKYQNVPCSGLISNPGVSCTQHKKNKTFHVYTHRSMSKGYSSLADIPISQLDSTASTG